MFRSLFSWITLTDAQRISECGPACLTEGFPILVLVDHAHRHPRPGERAATCLDAVVSDPCSRGSRSPTFARWPATVRTGTTGFDPLFSWITLTDYSSPPEAHSRSTLLSFDPCSRGSRSPTWGKNCMDTDQSSFRSLFSWITSLTDLGSADGHSSPGMKFRSLFSWITLTDVLYRRPVS